MVPIRNLLFSGIMFVGAVSFLWAVSNEMLNLKKIKKFLPFFFIGTLFSLEAGLVLNQIDYQEIWYGIEFLFALLLLLNLIILINKK